MRGLTLVVLLLSGCMTGQVMELRRNQALKAARFDLSCPTMQLGAELPDGSGAMRYRIVGCGKSAVYVCANAGMEAQRQDLTSLMVVGSQTIDARCMQLSQETIAPPPVARPPRVVVAPPASAPVAAPPPPAPPATP